MVLDAPRLSGSARLYLGVIAAVVSLGAAGAASWPALRPSGPDTRAGTETPQVLPPPESPAPETVSPPLPTVADDATAFDLEAIASGAPLPRAAAMLLAEQGSPVVRGDSEARLRRLLAQALLADEAVANERERLWSLRQAQASGTPLPAEDRLWLAVLRDRYEAATADVQELSLRVDTVPPSLLMAASMAAVSAKAAARIGDDAPRQVTARAPARDDVRTPLHVLNTHRAYAAFRRERAEMRRASAGLDALRLAAVLPAEGAGGVPGGKAIAAIITDARLTRFDAARLQPARAATMR